MIMLIISYNLMRVKSHYGSKLLSTVTLSSCNLLQYIFFVRHCHSTKVMKVLNVAEKNDAAKNIAAYLSRGSSQRVTKSRYN